MTAFIGYLFVSIIVIFLLLCLRLLLRKTKLNRPSTSQTGIRDDLTRGSLRSINVLHFFRLEGDQHLFNLALKPRSCGGEGKCEELAMVGDRILDLIVVKELLQRAEKVSKFVSREKIQHWVTTEKKEYVTNKVLAKFAYRMGIDKLLPSRTMESDSGSNNDFSHRDLGTVCEALLGACAEVNGDVTAGTVVKEMMMSIDNIVFDTLKSLFKASGHEMFKLVQVNQQSNSDYLRFLLFWKQSGFEFLPLAKTVLEHEEKLLKTGKPLNEHLLYTYEVSVETYPGLYCREYHKFTGLPFPDIVTARRNVLSIFFAMILVIPNFNRDPEGPKHYYLCLDPSTNTSGGKYPILQFLRRSGQNNPPRFGGPPPGSCGSPVYALDPITLAADQIQGMYSCHQNPPQLNLHPCKIGLFSNRDRFYKHGGLITVFRFSPQPRSQSMPPGERGRSQSAIEEKKQNRARKRNRKRK